MLRVVAHKSAAAARQYYAECLRREDYYSEKQEVIGKWHGKAAMLLGLKGNVTPEAFAALTENRHPETDKPLTPRMKADRRVGYDLNFHAPKSLSIIHALNGDERIVEAFREAVAETMVEVEALAATRIRRGGAQGERFTGNLVWAEFVHFTARPVDGIPDPLLHVHAFTFNATHDEVEGRWKAVSWAGIKSDAPYSEAVFHARLSEKIAALGYRIERSRYNWEIAGVSREIIERFSRRTALINELAATKGISDPKDLDGLGAKTREGKRYGLTQSELLSAWRERLSADELTQLSKLGSVGRAAPVVEVMTARKALDEAEEKLFAKNSVVEVRRLIAEALHFGVGQLSPEKIWSEFSQRGMVVREIDGEVLCTSRSVLAEEVALINFARSGRSTCAQLSYGTVLFGNQALSAEQRAGVLHILKSRDQVIGLRGAAGVGKTTALVEAIGQIEAAGFKVFAFAPSAAASRGTLREAGFANAETVAHLLNNKRLQQETRGQVIWIDEAGLVGTHDMLEILRIAGSSTRVILTGDTAQHTPVARGDAFRLIQHYAGLRVAELTEIRRQEREDYRKAVAALSKGDLRTGFRRLEELGAIIEVADEASRHRLLAQDFLMLSHGTTAPLVISPTHAEGAKVTAAIREVKREARQLGAEKLFLQYHDLKWEAPDRRRAENYREGLLVQFNQNTKGIRRGALFKVLGRDDAGAVLVRDSTGRESTLPLQDAARFEVFEERQIALAAGDRIRITRNGKSADGRRLNNGDLQPIAKIARDGRIILKSGAELDPKHGHLTYGYCQTSHSSQSKSVRDVLVAQSTDSNLLASSREQFYVSVSRGKETVRIYTDDRELLQEAVGNSSQRRSGVELAQFTKKEISGLMSGELDSSKWRDLIQSRRGDGAARGHVQNLLRERRQEPLAKGKVLDFQQYVQMRRNLAGPDGKSRSKGQGPTPKQHGISKTQGRSFLRPTELTTPTKEKMIAAAQNKQQAPKPKPAVPPRERIAAKAVKAAKTHFQKIATRTKTAVQSFKKGVRSKAFPEPSVARTAKQRVKTQQTAAPAAKAKTVEKAVRKAPTPPPPSRGPRR